MAFKMRGNPFKQTTAEEREANLAYAAKPKWWKTDPHLLKERGFEWDDNTGSWTHKTQEGLTQAQWE